MHTSRAVVATCSLFMLVLLACSSSLQAQAQEARVPHVRVDATVGAAAIMTMSDEYLTGVQRSLRLLALTEEVKSGDWDRMKGVLAGYSARDIEAAVWFARPDGSYYTVDKGLTDQNIKDRPYFPKAVAGHETLGDLVISKSTGKYVAVVTAPVKQGDAVVGILGASIYLERISSRIAQALRLPDNLHFWACDAAGKIVAINRRTDRLFWDPTNLNSPTLTQSVAQMLAKPEGSISYDFAGKKTQAVYLTSPVTGWHFVFGVLKTIK